MTLIDYSVFVVILLSALMGLVRGFTREVLSLISWMGAVTSTLMFWPLAQHVARQYIEHPMLADGATILILFVLFLVLFSLISYFLSNLVRKSMLGGVDRSLGALFGVLRGMAVLCLIELFMSCFVARAQHPDVLSHSKFAGHIYRGSDLLFNMLPQTLQDFIRQQQVKYAQGGISPAKLGGQAAMDAMLNQAQVSVNEMAALKPKVATPNPNQEEENPNYSKKQRQDMDRLLLQEGEN